MRHTTVRVGLPGVIFVWPAMAKSILVLAISGGPEKGESYIFCWDPSKRDLKKIADLNKITGAKPNEVHFSKVHAHIIEGKDKKIYFTGTLDDGGKAGSEEMLKKWTASIAGGKLFQYDPATGNTVAYADFPKARVTATTKYDAKRNILYCALEGDPEGFAFGAFDMDKREWIYQGEPGLIGDEPQFHARQSGKCVFQWSGDSGSYRTSVKSSVRSLADRSKR